MITDEAKTFLRNGLKYDPDKGTLLYLGIWQNATSVVRTPGGGRKYVVVTSDFGDIDAASVCWFLHTDNWPEFGVRLVNVSDGLKKSNLRRVSRNEYVRMTERTVSVDLIGRCADLLWEVIDAKTKDGIAAGIDVAGLVVKEMALRDELLGVLKGRNGG